MLLAIRSLIQARGQASLSDLALHFRVSPEAMQGMVKHWIAKGQVRRQSCGRSNSAPHNPLRSALASCSSSS